MSQFARSILIAALCVIALLPALASTQQQQTQPQQQTQQQQPPPQPPRFRTETNFVRVDAYATKDGVPVQDMKAEDFEVFEDNTPQKIDSFEHIVVTPAGPADTLVEPNSVQAANALAADPRRRVFVLYLDTEQVTVEGSHAIKEPLIDLMTRVMSADDLVGVMTPMMSPSQITFGRRTQVIEEGLRRNWAWGRHDSIMLDEREELYSQCFPPVDPAEGVPSVLAKKMIQRRRERLVLDSLQDLIRHMAAVREGRTAVITVSDGWKLFRPDPTMTGIRKDAGGHNADPIPGAPPPVGVGPGGGLTTRINNGGFAPSDRTECEKDRADLAMVDNERMFRDLFGEANRANVSFYTIDPRGLPSFDTPIGPDPPLPPAADHAQLITRQESLRTLALNTDGIALLNSNDLKTQVRRVADDLTSYYLMGYYSTNGKLDGRFRNIKVRSKRSGVEVRSRRGYRAATQDEVDRARASASAPIPENKAALTRALGYIESDARAQGRKTTRGPGEPMVYHRGPATGNQVQPADGRVFPRSERIRMEMEAQAGAPVWSGVLLDRNGGKTIVPVTTTERTDASTGQRWLTADITLAPLGPGDYVVELTTTAGTEQKKTLVAIRVTQ
ncbi:MAG TPA: VWA domain-containing protein [Vicinamibacterales bacterium]|nr:VWA domain-containing protein [Vicinamibacterales bacterium]